MCLEKDPADRFPNAAAFAVALDGGSMPTLATRASAAASSAGTRASTREREITEPLRDRYTPPTLSPYAPAEPSNEEISSDSCIIRPFMGAPIQA